MEKETEAEPSDADVRPCADVVCRLMAPVGGPAASRPRIHARMCHVWPCSVNGRGREGRPADRQASKDRARARAWVVGSTSDADMDGYTSTILL
jgi:hypothetical protein